MLIMDIAETEHGLVSNARGEIAPLTGLFSYRAWLGLKMKCAAGEISLGGVPAHVCSFINAPFFFIGYISVWVLQTPAGTLTLLSK